MAGIPPLLGFFSKQFVLLSAIQNGYVFMAFAAILTSVISASYYLRVVVLLVNSSDTSATGLLINSNSNSNSNSPIISSQSMTKTKLLSVFNSESILTNFHSFLISTITLSIVLFILKPTILLNSTQLLSLSMFYS